MQITFKTVKMGATWIRCLPSLALLLLKILSAEGAAIYQLAVSLEDRCGSNVMIPCPPNPVLWGSAGTVRFHLIPTDDCNVTLALDKGCGNSWDTYAIYINMRNFVLPRSDRITVSEVLENGRLIVHKDLSGTQIRSSRPPSVAQLLTSYSRQPALKFYYTRGSSPSTYSHEAYFDYVIVEKESKARNSYCRALSGYVYDDYICDTDGGTDRINCPGNFGLHSSTETNPAYSRQCTGTVTTTQTPNYYWTSTEYHYSSTGNNDGLSGGAVAGIVVGVVFFIIFLVAVISSTSSSRRSVTRPVVFSSTPGTVNISHPTVVGNYAPPSAATAPPFMGAPPSYAEVTAPNSNFPVPPDSNKGFSAPYPPNSSFPSPRSSAKY